MKKVAFYGGSFDPPHKGHLTIARKLTEIFELDEFLFIPACHAPHKKDKQPTSAFHRLAMLCLATESKDGIKVSTVELDAPEKPFTFETQDKLKRKMTDAEIFFVIGADSWAEIDTWREWEKVLTATNIIVVTRPDYDIDFTHVTEKIRERIVDLRGGKLRETKEQRPKNKDQKIYFTDAINVDVSSTEIRQIIRAGKSDWRKLMSQKIAKYIEKYGLYV